MTKKKLLRRPTIQKAVENENSQPVLPAVRPSLDQKKKDELRNQSQAPKGTTSSRLFRADFKSTSKTNEAKPQQSVQFDDLIQTQSLKAFSSTQENIASERNPQVQRSEDLTTTTPTTRKRYSVPSDSLAVRQIANPREFIETKNKYGPMPYRARGPEGFPVRRPKALPELQKGVTLKSWNDILTVPEFRSCDRFVEYAHMPRVFSNMEPEAELVFLTLEKPTELVRPKSLCDLSKVVEKKKSAPIKTKPRRRRIKKKRSKVAVTTTGGEAEVAGYDPNELLDAICDWKPEKSFDEMMKARRRSILIPIHDRAVTAPQNPPNSEHSLSEVSSAPLVTQKVDQNKAQVEVAPPNKMSFDDHDNFTTAKSPRKIAKVSLQVKIEDSVKPMREGMAKMNSLHLYNKHHSLTEKRRSSGGWNHPNVSSGQRRMSNLIKLNEYALQKEAGNEFMIEGNKHNERDSKSKSLVDDQELTRNSEISSSVVLLDPTSLGQQQHRIPKHMAILGLKKLFKGKIEERNIETPYQLFNSGVLEETLEEVDKIADMHAITRKERVRAIIAATQEYFKQIVNENEHTTSGEEDKLEKMKEEEIMLTNGQMEVLASLTEGGQVLTLKAHFLTRLPDLSSLRKTLVCLNLSFNSFTEVPEELFSFENLQFLKLRDNPLKSISHEIYKLTHLRSLVVSFCCLTELPSGIFLLKHLEFLDVSYNLLTSLSRDVENLVALKFLSLEGNELIGLPCTMLPMDIIRVRIKNNFMSPSFWPETCAPQLAKLSDLCLTKIQRTFVSPEAKQLLSENLLLKLSCSTACDCCGDPMYGPGMHVLRHRKKIWGLRQVPFVFRSCSTECHHKFATSDYAATLDNDIL